MKRFSINIVLVVGLSTLMMACSQRRPPVSPYSGITPREVFPGIRSASQLNSLTHAALGVNPPTDFNPYQQLLARISNGQTTSTTTRQGNLDHSALACQIAVQREANLAHERRRVFAGVNFSASPSQFTPEIVRSVAHNLFARSLGRVPTFEELNVAVGEFSDLRAAVGNPDANGTLPGDQQTQLLSQVFCTVVFASVLATSYYPE